MADDEQSPTSDPSWWRRLSLEQWSHLAQIVGTLGVIVALVSLLLQVSANTQVLRLSAMDNTLSTYNAMRLALMDNPNLSQIALTGFEDREALNETDRFRFDTYLQYLFFSGHAHFTRTLLVESESGLWSSSAAWYRGLLQENPGVVSWWCDQRGGFNPGFVEAIEEGWRGRCSTQPPELRSSK